LISFVDAAFVTDIVDVFVAIDDGMDDPVLADLLF
jgi:hypothetical protein